MAVWSVASNREIVSAGRTDAEYFHPDFLIAEKKLLQHPTIQISKEFFISDGNHLGVSKHFTTDGSVPYYRGQDINDFFLENANPVRIPQWIFDKPNMLRSHFSAKDILICIVGASTGTIGLVSDGDTPCTGSCKIGIVRRKPNGIIDPLFLSAFLLGKYGQYQIKRNSRGTAQGGLILIDLLKLYVPVFPEPDQIVIRGLVSQAVNFNSESRKKLMQAQLLLETELGLDKLRFDKPVGYTARFSELELSRRADAEYFNPELRYFHCEIAKKHSLKSITEYAKILKLSNPSYGSEGVPIITQKHLGEISPDKYGDDLIAQDSWVNANPLAVLRKNDLLYYSVGAYLGKTNLWLSDDRAVHASFITMLRCHDQADAGFLQVLLNSTYGILQSKCFQSGTSQPYIYPKDIRRFLVPDVSVSLRQEIHDLVFKSYEKAKESKRLLDQAKTRVEELIEEAVQA